MKKLLCRVAAAIGFAALGMNVHAEQGKGGKGDMEMDCMKNMGNMKMDCMGSNSTEAAAMADGEVRKVDVAKKSITLKHGPIKNLNMPGMTMAFPVKDPAMLSNVKVGDKVKFTAENVANVATITSLSVQK